MISIFIKGKLRRLHIGANDFGNIDCNRPLFIQLHDGSCLEDVFLDGTINICGSIEYCFSKSSDTAGIAIIPDKVYGWCYLD